MSTFRSHVLLHAPPLLASHPAWPREAHTLLTNRAESPTFSWTTAGYVLWTVETKAAAALKTHPREKDACTGALHDWFTLEGTSIRKPVSGMLPGVSCAVGMRQW